jgi:hypothetical protein
MSKAHPHLSCSSPQMTHIHFPLHSIELSLCLHPGGKKSGKYNLAVLQEEKEASAGHTHFHRLAHTAWLTVSVPPSIVPQEAMSQNS